MVSFFKIPCRAAADSFVPRSGYYSVLAGYWAAGSQDWRGVRDNSARLAETIGGMPANGGDCFKLDKWRPVEPVQKPVQVKQKREAREAGTGGVEAEKTQRCRERGKGERDGRFQVGKRQAAQNKIFGIYTYTWAKASNAHELKMLGSSLHVSLICG